MFEPNLYGYAGGNPIRYTDPTGEFVWVLPALWWLGGAIAEYGMIVVGVGAAAVVVTAVSTIPGDECDREDYCEWLYKNDCEICDTLDTSRKQALCYGRAALRQANCLRGLPIPEPLVLDW